MSKKSRRVFYITVIDGPIAGSPMLTHARLGPYTQAVAGEQLVVVDYVTTQQQHLVEVIDPAARTARWIRAAGPIVMLADRSVSVGFNR